MIPHFHPHITIEILQQIYWQTSKLMKTRGKTFMMDIHDPGRIYFSSLFVLLCLKCHFQQYFSYSMAGSFISGGNRSTRRKPPTCNKSLTNFIT
jgi:hypothetical protein